MIWIPPGTLIAGTAKDRIPRVADEELVHEPVELDGFYIDEYPYPNEPGAIARTGMSRDESLALCTAQDKRLCTELEWERACKGPDNTTYEYGETYRPNECGTGIRGRLAPSGLLVGCKSGFGVHDMHGGPWEWTASSWSRGTLRPTEGGQALFALRGGNSEPGELVGRCANGMGRQAGTKRPDISMRCCAGPANRAEVKLTITHGKTLDPRPLEPSVVRTIERALAQVSEKDVPIGSPLRIDRIWVWRPVGNEELLLVSVYVRRPDHLLSGVVAFRTGTDPLRLGAYAASGWWLPILKTDSNGRDVWINGGDNLSGFRTRMSYAWGRIIVGEVVRAASRSEQIP